ncbi:hypothetical protein BDV40DRAFT_280140, partial [Aspergillus tamarii]
MRLLKSMTSLSPRTTVITSFVWATSLMKRKSEPKWRREPEAPTESFSANSVASYLCLDISGRVIRLDSTSKIIAPGLRAGWATAAIQVIDIFLSYQQVNTFTGVPVALQHSEYGMFLWIKLDWGVHPRLCTPSASGDESDLQLHKLEHRIAAKALEYRVLVKKRSLFSFKKCH